MPTLTFPSLCKVIGHWLGQPLKLPHKLWSIHGTAFPQTVAPPLISCPFSHTLAAVETFPWSAAHPLMETWHFKKGHLKWQCPACSWLPNLVSNHQLQKTMKYFDAILWTNFLVVIWRLVFRELTLHGWWDVGIQALTDYSLYCVMQTSVFSPCHNTDSIRRQSAPQYLRISTHCCRRASGNGTDYNIFCL